MRRREPLTARQRDVLRVVAEWWEIEGMAPTLAEIAREVGLRSESTVHAHMEQLAGKGYIRRSPRRTWRSWEVVE